MKKYLFLLFFNVLFISYYCKTEAQQLADSARIHLRTSIGKTSIKLRWAVNSPQTWKTNLHAGYIIERYTDFRDGKLLNVRETKILTTVPLRPSPLAEWEHLAKNNHYAAVIAQAIYGESFEISGMESGQVAQLVQQTRELEQRYTFAMYSADMSFEAAGMAGWAYEDKDIRPGECYLYRVIPVETIPMKTPIHYGFSYCCVDEHRELPAPIQVRAEFGDKTVMLFWNNEVLKNSFSAYQIERSEDNHHFESLGAPVAPISDQHTAHSMYQDSLTSNNKMYHYRLKGISPFGELGPPSDTVSGMGQETLKFVPQIIRSEVNKEGLGEVEWTFNEGGNRLIRSFTLKRSDTSTGEYKTLVDGISCDKRSIFFDELKTSNYLIIEAEPISGKSTRSFPILLMTPDSIPPAAPLGLIAATDTLGRIHIQWKVNTEADLLGYKIYSANQSEEALIVVNDSIITKPLFTDSVDLNNLNQSVYYAIKAFDKRYNQSKFSTKIKVEKPLKVRPTAPVFTSYNVEGKGVLLNWTNCPDEICIRHHLYRQHQDSATKIRMKVFEGKTINQYQDSTVKENTTYTYSLTAVSKWNVESMPSPELRVSTSAQNNPELIRQFKFTQENQKINLHWLVSDRSQVRLFRIYRSEVDAALSIWKELEGTSQSVIDENAKTGLLYKYLLVAILSNGTFSNTKEITVNN